MDKERQAAFKGARFSIVTVLNETCQVCEYLVSKGQLNETQKRSILSYTDPVKQNSHLCDILSTRDNSAYDHFLAALIEVNAAPSLIALFPPFSVSPNLKTSFIHYNKTSPGFMNMDSKPGCHGLKILIF